MSETPQPSSLENNAQAFVLDDVLDISGVGDLHSRLRESLKSGEPVSFDAGSVERVDTAALQLLSAFVQDARSKKIPVSWQSPSDALRQSARLLGLESVLNLETTTNN